MIGSKHLTSVKQLIQQTLFSHRSHIHRHFTFIGEAKGLTSTAAQPSLQWEEETLIRAGLRNATTSFWLFQVTWKYRRGSDRVTDMMVVVGDTLRNELIVWLDSWVPIFLLPICLLYRETMNLTVTRKCFQVQHCRNYLSWQPQWQQQSCLPVRDVGPLVVKDQVTNPGLFSCSLFIPVKNKQTLTVCPWTFSFIHYHVKGHSWNLLQGVQESCGWKVCDIVLWRTVEPWFDALHICAGAEHVTNRTPTWSRQD